MSTQSRLSDITVAVLFQDIEPPVINGVHKPKKPSGYKDSGADIAFTLQRSNVKVLTPQKNPNPLLDSDWCFSDTEEGILCAIRQGATHIWANTVVFEAHPLQTSSRLQQFASQIYIVGQPPRLVEKFDDKAYLNDKLRALESYTLPQSWLVNPETIEVIVRSIKDYPVVAKPVRGRGSHGVKVCYDLIGLKNHLDTLFQESPTVLVEEYLAGEEATITVMPPSRERGEYWSLPPVTRFNHLDGIAPYNGVVAVTTNSRVVTQSELDADLSYYAIMDECRNVAKLIQATAPIRIDVRRFSPGSNFALFDINMKPNMTGPGRPGRDNQDSLTAIAAAGVGWDYVTLLQTILQTSQTLGALRTYVSPL
uniref:ATP-grasp domain-containing protein n=1 Tax=Talaromyces amestolkiae TaxID=1196081 RepID=A0A364KP00_TALAM